ncbi:3'(2'),5'-bisphosphate nucleotidase [Monosporozyma unispora]|nr:3'(2'),5'-bisphosphate nucleotidase [Kazachstania unispora]
MAFERELLVATHAVRKASFLTKRVQQSIIQHRNETTITKTDNSPVTMGDYAAQTIIINTIKANFPEDCVVGEESAEGLDDNFLSSILKEIQDNDKVYIDNKTDGDVAFTNEQFSLTSIENVKQIINFGDYKGGNKGRFWCLDPIDGTKGFLRGEQFAVCLALIVDGVVKCGVIGCPNLKLSQYDNAREQIGENVDESFGYIFRAVRGQGAAFTDTLSMANWKPTHVRHLQDTKDMITLEGVEKGHSSHDEQDEIKSRLNITKSIHLDSQVKYCLLAMGLADVYLRLPIKMSYQEKIWDHAAGNAIVLESGGLHTDSLQNKTLNFSQGRTLLTKGVIATSGPTKLHDLVVSTSNDVISSRK